MRQIIRLSITVALTTAGWFVFNQPVALRTVTEIWSASVEPGKHSKFHANLESNCQECHSPLHGVVRDQCVTCHAAQTELLKKQNTTFHASVGSCTGCHFEHQGRDAWITKMDHSHLAPVGLEMLDRGASPESTEQDPVAKILSSLRFDQSDFHGTDLRAEKMLNCNSCHANQDKHLSLFGNDCSTCHDTAQWSIARFRHPYPTSRDCSQCHQSPPSHYMMHFQMISQKIAGDGAEPNSGCCKSAKVEQCFLCHQTNAWNDIKGIGWYKHH